MKKKVIKVINKQVVGIDVGKDEFYVCYKIQTDDGKVIIKGTKSFKNDLFGMTAFYKWCENRNKTSDIKLIFIMEATGVYYEELAYFLNEKGEKLSVQLAQKMKYFAKSNNLKTKTDKVDSKVIAEFGIEKNLKGTDFWIPPSEDFKMIRNLTREHTSLKKVQSAAKAQLHALNHSHKPYEEVVNMKKEQIAFYEQQIKKTKKEILKLVKTDNELYEKIKKIETTKGIGFMTIITVLTEVNGFLLFTSIRQLVSYAGLDVVEDSSGNHKGRTKISKKGNARIRSALYMPALNAIQYNKDLQTFYERVTDDREVKQQGVVAVMRKLLIIIYTLWKKNEEYIEDYQNKKMTSGNDED
jgi:transposase